VAFCDDDCMPDPHWLRHLVAALLDGRAAGVGGPNVPPPDTLLAESVGHAPGGPMHVLVSDVEAEHIPGCNMAFRRAALAQVGGFDARFRVAGDDVDLCWRIQEAGGTLAFSPGALVWHRARRSVAAYLRQQAGYGRAEALLERKWPDRYNHHGHVSWSGTVYGGKVRRSLGRRRWRVYHGPGGGSLFQSVYGRHGGGASAFPLTPEWHLVLLGLAVAALARVPLALPLLAACVAAVAAQAAAWTLAVVLPTPLSRRRRLGVRAVVFALCMLQPVARLWGRARPGHTPWRCRGGAARACGASAGTRPSGGSSACTARWRSARRRCSTAATSTPGTSRCASARSPRRGSGSPSRSTAAAGSSCACARGRAGPRTPSRRARRWSR
jgi:hypothetical protein